MSLYDYKISRQLRGTSFYALLMAAVHEADSTNRDLLEAAFPEVVAEVQARYEAPSGLLPSDPGYEAVQQARAAQGLPT